MSKMWKGECDELRATYANPIATRLHRRAGEQLIAYRTDHSGRRAEVYRMEKRGDQWYFVDLGVVEGGDPMNTFINASLAYTEHDHELFSLIARHLGARTDEVLTILHDCGKKLDSALADLGDSIASLAQRYV
jgi:hypothetical protein